MIKAIFFDIGGVLMDLDYDNCVRAFHEILGFERVTEILDPYKQKGVFGQLECGEISLEDFYAAILAESRPGATPEDVDNAIGAFLVGMDPRKAPLLQRLAREYTLFSLSNNNPIAMKCNDRVFARFDMKWDDIFTDNYISCWMKMEKPGQEIYREAIRRSGFPREEILYIDDAPANVEAGLKAGLRSVLYVAGSDLEALIEANL